MHVSNDEMICPYKKNVIKIVMEAFQRPPAGMNI